MMAGGRAKEGIERESERRSEGDRKRDFRFKNTFIEAFSKNRNDSTDDRK